MDFLVRFLPLGFLVVFFFAIGQPSNSDAFSVAFFLRTFFTTFFFATFFFDDRLAGLASAC